ncbi:MAG: hypothetical protein PVSMB7_29720 [Chloroflexota bacterium]
MAKYLIFVSYTDTAVERMLNHPSDRAEVVGKLIAAAGGRMESFYWMLGPHDCCVIGELPDANTAAALALSTVSAHGLKSFETYELLEHSNIASIEEKARQLRKSYQPPGQES